MFQISLKAARVNAGLSQAEAAKKLGIDRTTLQKYESSKSLPDVLMAQKISALYAIPTDHIIFLPKNIAKSGKIKMGA